MKYIYSTSQMSKLSLTLCTFSVTGSVTGLFLTEEAEHDEIVEEVVKRLVENDLYMKLEKCKWKVREIGFIGVVIGLEGIKMEEEKVKEVLDWLIPKGVKDIQKFLGLTNYYHQFIKDFTAIARPLHDMVKKN